MCTFFTVHVTKLTFDIFLFPSSMFYQLFGTNSCRKFTMEPQSYLNCIEICIPMWFHEIFYKFLNHCNDGIKLWKSYVQINFKRDFIVVLAPLWGGYWRFWKFKPTVLWSHIWNLLVNQKWKLNTLPTAEILSGKNAKVRVVTEIKIAILIPTMMSCNY